MSDTLSAPLAEPDSYRQPKQYCGTARELNLGLQFTCFIYLYEHQDIKKTTRFSFLRRLRYILTFARNLIKNLVWKIRI